MRRASGPHGIMWNLWSPSARTRPPCAFEQDLRSASAHRRNLRKRRPFSRCVEEGSIPPPRGEVVPFSTFSATCHNFRQPLLEKTAALNFEGAARNLIQQSLTNRSREVEFGPGSSFPALLFARAPGMKNRGLGNDKIRPVDQHLLLLHRDTGRTAHPKTRRETSLSLHPSLQDLSWP